MGPWWLLYRGRYGQTDPHAHHAVQILSSSTKVTVLDEAGHPTSGLTLAIPSDVHHQIDSSGRAVIVFVDADSAVGRRLARSCGSHIAACDGFVPVDALNAAAVVEQLLVLVDPAASETRPVSSAIAQVLAALADDPDAGTARQFASRVGLSPSRFSARFSREVGIPLRSYRRWVRMLHAVDALAAGASITEAAHRAGFTDSAHLTHTFRAHFGLAPRDLLAATQFEDQ
jgi:AraC-like DNA-binding protein